MTKPVDIQQIDIAAIFYKATGHNPDEPKKLIVNDWKRTKAKEWGEDEGDRSILPDEDEDE